MSDLSVRTVLTCKDTPIWIDNACCGCQHFYSMEGAKELIAQLDFAVIQVESEKNRARSEALQKAFDKLPTDKRLAKITEAFEGFTDALRNSSLETFIDKLRERTNKENTD